MSFSSQSHNAMLYTIIGCILVMGAAPVCADDAAIPVLTLRISDTTVHVGDTNAWVSVCFGK